MTLPAGLRLRQAVSTDAGPVADVFITSRAAADIPPSVHDDADVRRWVAEHLLPNEDVWVAVADDDLPVAFVALTPGWVELLFVAPSWVGQQIGAA